MYAFFALSPSKKKNSNIEASQVPGRIPTAAHVRKFLIHSNV
jgi:hypothetical protein